MPWMWPDLIFKFLPEGREHDRCLKIVHQFTEKVIHDRAQTFHASEVQTKRPAFLGKLFSTKQKQHFLFRCTS
jgi:hypothetical protein